uniref:Uncharacterized protein n=1 Tax=uncultured Chloroflexota bacterium TaxID=166587 RepID=H5SPI3_9CHLR|nr:hypothetical protein HGMM_F54B02C34 [uncultured Chloroflexota bacterium]
MDWGGREGKRKDVLEGLLPQVGQALLHGLDFEFEFGQVGLQFGDLLGFGLVAAVQMVTAATIAVAVVVAVAAAAAVTAAGAVFAAFTKKSQ